MQASIKHDTLQFERTFQCPLQTLWNAFESAEARARWGVPSPDAIIIYDKEDFRVGGRDLLRCGGKDDPRFRVEVTYLDILPSRRIIHSEQVSDEDGLLSCALHTIELAEAPDGIRLSITVQIASIGNADMAGGVRQGMAAALDNLAADLTRARRAATRH